MTALTEPVIPFTELETEPEIQLPQSVEPSTLDTPTPAESSADGDESVFLSPFEEKPQFNGISDPTTNTIEDSPEADLLAALRFQINDLNSQVSSLNSKLVNSYTRIGDLEDDLHEKGETAQRATAKVQELEKNKVTWEAEIETGGWIERDHVQGEMQRLMAKVLEETKSRETADLARTTLEEEIDNLTSSLFTEANKMVASERIARALAEEKMRSLEAGSNDMAGILEGLQGTLREKVELLDETERESIVLKRRLGIPALAESSLDSASSPILFSDGENITVAGNSTPGLPSSAMINQSSLPLTLPRLLTSVPPYHEFLGFIAYLRRLRVTVLSVPPPELSAIPAGSGRGFGAFSPAVVSPNYASTAGVPPTPAQLLAPHLPLSSHLAQPFLKRCVEEDSDPSLRLDLAPGLGFLSRRTVGTAIVDGTLLIEPSSAGAPVPSATCCLCGIALDKWFHGDLIVVGSKPTVNQTVNSTMKKVLGAGSWSISSFTSKKESALPHPPSSPSTSEPPPPETPPKYPRTTSVGGENSFIFPTPQNQSIHIFRINDTSTTRYAICPSYCLPRLRAVCEFWTYVRVMERGLLLEEGFKFVGGNGLVSNLTLGSSSSLKRDVGASVESLVEEKEEVEVAETAVETEAGEGDVGATPLELIAGAEETRADAPVVEVEKQTPAVESEGEKVERTEPTVEPTPTPTSTLPEQQEGDIIAVDVTHQFASRPPVTVSTTSRPPVPKRSVARSAPSPVLSTAPGYDPTRVTVSGSSNTSGPPRPPPRHPLRHGLARSVRNSLSAPDEVAEMFSGAIGWEDRCWSEVVKLKESTFWARIGAADVQGSARLKGILAEGESGR